MLPENVQPTVTFSQPSNPPPQGDIKSDLNRFFSEATKYTVLALFILYAVGFLIWHSYLATYSVSSVGFLQTEYLSAALCYFIIVVSFATPPVVFLETVRKKYKRHDIHWLIYLWYLVSIRLVETFFPDNGGSIYLFRYTAVGVSIILLYVITLFALEKKYKGNKTYNTLRGIDIFSILLVGYIIIFIVFHKDVSKLFVIFSVFIYYVLVGVSGKDIRKVWANSDYKLRLLLLTLVAFILLYNVEYFGSNQFGKIPRQVGGGKTEIAYVKFEKQYEDVPLALGIPIAANPLISGNFYGPVNLLLRTDRELIFLIPNEAKLPDVETNETIINTPTNLILSIVTNFNYSYLTNGSVVTGLIHPIVTYNIATNFSSINIQTIDNLTKKTAKQVRSDMVESVIFSR